MKSGKRFLNKVAVAAVAVAGVLGMVGTGWGQTSPVTGGASFGSKTMAATFTVQQDAEINATSNFVDLVVWDDAGTNVFNTQPVATDVVGTLGTIRVKTNSAGWDVLMTTENGGRMLDLTSKQCVDVPNVDGWGNPTGGTHPDCSGAGAGTYLMYDNDPTNATAHPTVEVVLDVAIGVAKQGIALGNTVAKTRLYPLLNSTSGTSPTFEAPVLVQKSSVTGSDLSQTTHNAVSFAYEIGAAYSSTTLSGVYSQGIYGSTTNTKGNWGTINSSGFPKPGEVKGIYVGPNDQQDEEFFYVNVGIGQSVYDNLKGNQNGTFTETFNFELVAKF
jgi:hypothetical protein